MSIHFPRQLLLALLVLIACAAESLSDPRVPGDSLPDAPHKQVTPRIPETNRIEPMRLDRRISTHRTDLVGGDGGQPFSFDCPADRALVGFEGTTTGGGEYVRTLLPLCHELFIEQGRIVQQSETASGHSQRGRIYDFEPLRCPRDQLAIGIFGRSGTFVDRIGLICAEFERGETAVQSEASPDSQTDAGTGLPGDEQHRAVRFGEESPSDPIGGTGGSEFELRCPDGSVVHGIQGRAGDWMDAVGINCIELESLLESTD